MLRLVCLITFFTLALGACSDDAPAADADIDGAIIDAAIDGAPDAFDPCPGETTFESEIVDPGGDRIEQSITVTELDTSNTTTAAPNGRAILCIDHMNETATAFETMNYLTTTHSLLPSVTQDQFASTVPYSVALYPQADADAFASGLGETRDGADSIVFVDVHAFPAGTPLAGVTVDLGASYDGAYAADDAGNYTPGKTTQAGGRIAFINVDATTADTSVTITPPGGMTCEGPESAVVAAGEISSALHGCR